MHLFRFLCWQRNEATCFAHQGSASLSAIADIDCVMFAAIAAQRELQQMRISP